MQRKLKAAHSELERKDAAVLAAERKLQLWATKDLQAQAATIAGGACNFQARHRDAAANQIGMVRGQLLHQIENITRGYVLYSLFRQ